MKAPATMKKGTAGRGEALQRRRHALGHDAGHIKSDGNDAGGAPYPIFEL